MNDTPNRLVYSAGKLPAHANLEHLKNEAKQRSAGVERLITDNLTASATFLFARGVRLSRARNANLLTPVLLTPDNAASLGIPNPFLSRLGGSCFRRRNSHIDSMAFINGRTTPVRFICRTLCS